MPKVQTFEIDIRNPQPLSFELDGRKYTLRLGKREAVTPDAAPAPAKPDVVRAGEGVPIDAARTVVRKLPAAGSSADAALFELNFEPGAGIRRIASAVTTGPPTYCAEKAAATAAASESGGPGSTPGPPTMSNSNQCK